MQETKRIAFALGGLAGNNAHGAGFLEAALANGVEPAMISCTSGQIYWVYQYLRCRAAGKPGLRAVLQDDIRKVETFHNPDLDTAALAMWGKKGVFRTAYAEYLSEAYHNAVRLSTRMFTRKGRQFFLRSFLELFPCRILMPDFPGDFLQQISDELNNSDIGIVFNSFNPADGHEYLHLNSAARKLLSATSSHPERFNAGQPSSYRDRTTYQDITPDHVLDGLWLYQYGFPSGRKCVDGAYFRDIILSELTYAQKIYVVRPLHYHWSGELPRNYPEMEDLKTKLAFNGAYSGERYQIMLMNKLIDSGAVQAMVNGQPKYHSIELEEIEMDKRRGFFDYLFEDMSVFDEALAKATKALPQVRAAGPAAKVAEAKAVESKAAPVIREVAKAKAPVTPVMPAKVEMVKPAVAPPMAASSKPAAETPVIPPSPVTPAVMLPKPPAAKGKGKKKGQPFQPFSGR